MTQAPKVIYSRSLKKQVVLIVTWLFMTSLAGAALFPVDTMPKVIGLAVFAILFAVLVIYGLRRTVQKAPCPACGHDLYEWIPVNSSQFRHCPACGARIDV